MTNHCDVCGNEINDDSLVCHECYTQLYTNQKL
jgi:predicted nucleic acid-binding Zn ribbon protein